MVPYFNIIVHLLMSSYITTANTCSCHYVDFKHMINQVMFSPAPPLFSQVNLDPVGCDQLCPGSGVSLFQTEKLEGAVPGSSQERICSKEEEESWRVHFGENTHS